MSQSLKTVSTQYNRRARRYYRRLVIGQPAQPDEKPFRFLPEREVSETRQTKNVAFRPGGAVWLAVVLAIAAFTFICLLITIMLAQGIVS